METEPVHEIRRKCFKLTVEPVLFLFQFAYSIQAPVIQNLYLDKACQINYNLTVLQCTNLNETEHIELRDAIQEHVSKLNIYASCIENVPSILSVLFLGSWSTRQGRKLPMILPFVGQLLAVGIYTLNYKISEWPAEYILIGSISIGLCGGIMTILMGVHSYMADITIYEQRTFRMSFLYSVGHIGIPAGMFSSGLVFKYGGYLAVWGVSLTAVMIALFYLIFFLSDSRGRNNEEESVVINNSENKTPLGTNIFINAIQDIWLSVKTTFRQREGYQRVCICLLLAAMAFNVLSQVPSNVSYLFTRKQFSWDEPRYANFMGVGYGISAFGSLLIVPLLVSFLKLQDPILGTIAQIGSIATYIMYAFATTPLMLYLGSISLVLSPAISIAIRSSLSKIALHDESGHVFSVLASLESIIPLICSSTFNLVYEATIESLPGCVYLLGSGLQFFNVILFLCLLSSYLDLFLGLFTFSNGRKIGKYSMFLLVT